MAEAKVVEEAVEDLLAETAKHHSIQPGTPAYEAYLSAGYPDIGTIEHANEIITGREKDHSLYPWEVYQRAKAYKEAYYAKSWTTSHPPTDRRGNITAQPKGKRARQVLTNPTG